MIYSSISCTETTLG